MPDGIRWVAELSVGGKILNTLKEQPIILLPDGVLTEDSAGAINLGFIHPDAVFINAIHVKASTNKNKYVSKLARHRAHKYKRDLLIEINADCQAHGKEPIEGNTVEGEAIDSAETESNSSPKSDNLKIVKTSTTNPESGLFHKGGKEHCFFYPILCS